MLREEYSGVNTWCNSQASNTCQMMRAHTYTVEFWESVNTDTHSFLMDAWGGLGGWRRRVLRSGSRGESHGADGIA